MSMSRIYRRKFISVLVSSFGVVLAGCSASSSGLSADVSHDVSVDEEKTIINCSGHVVDDIQPCAHDVELTVFVLVDGVEYNQNVIVSIDNCSGLYEYSASFIIDGVAEEISSRVEIEGVSRR